MRQRLALLALVLAASACHGEAPAPPAAVPLYSGDFEPVDDGAADDAFNDFRDALRQSVAEKDTAALLAAIAPGARLSFGDEPGGPEGFRQMWLTGHPPGGEPVWAVLDRILAAGSVEQDGAYTVPYVYGLWPEDADPFGSVAVVGEDVPLYDQPRGEVVARATHRIFPILAPPLDGWWQVSLPDGSAAFVRTADALSPVGYRAGFWPEGDTFKLQLFLAGD